ncbi:ANTAR domain-containing protein [Streptomyces sp. NPDC001714]|uniref:ANTAR domain-containing protein n=1 Tax=Streptomyces sp. NPDC001714 TaxID=3364603 RepID=UPI0036A756EF
MLETSPEEQFAGKDGDDGPLPSTAGSLSVRVGADDDRVAVAVSGEFCLDNSQYLRHALHEALARSAAGVDLDLGGLGFTDCSALNVLLAVRGQALGAGKTVVITAASPAVQRLLSFTDTRTLFSAPASSDQAASDQACSDQASSAPADDGLLQTEVVQLRRALRTRPDIDLARGILMASFGLSPDEAWDVLVMASQNTNTKLHRLAQDVVTTVRGVPLPDQVQRQLTAAVADARGSGDRP